MRVYLDNAATTQLDPQIFEAMVPYLRNHYGNPSSLHSHGREARGAIEKSRKLIADLLQCSPAEIIFTSGGTEADNCIIKGAVHSFDLDTAITTRIEHHAVGHTIELLEAQGKIQVKYLDVDDKGHIDLSQLEEMIDKHPNSIVSLMQANNEIGTLHPVDSIAEICNDRGVFFHSDTVQAMGHYRHDLSGEGIHALTGSAHKFHGPKGVGFMYLCKKNAKIDPFVHGGGQERAMRAGTENVAGIVALAKGLELCYEHMDEHARYIQGLKDKMIANISSSIDDVSFNGDLDNSLYTVLNVCLPPGETGSMLLFDLDLRGISASGGSACTAGASTGSHVLAGIGSNPERGGVRFSFCKFNTEEEIDYASQQLSEIYQVEVS